jgi:hypothetical protein
MTSATHRPPGPDGGAPLRLDGVALVGRTEHGTTVVEGLALILDPAGVAILGPEAGSERRVAWAAVTAASCGGVQASPGGRAVVPLELTSSDRTLRFELDASRLSAALLDAVQVGLARWVPGAAAPAAAPVPAPPVAVVPPAPVTAAVSLPPPVGPPMFVPATAGYGPPPAGAPAYPSPYPPGPYAPLPYPSPYPPMVWAAPPPAKPRRTRRVALLVAGAVLVIGGVGLGVGLGSHHSPAPRRSAARVLTPDQHLADQLMLTTGDLPTGWTVASGGGGNVNDTPSGRAAQRQIEQTFVQCMGITPDQAATALGGQAADQTAASSSPVFIGPAAGAGTTTPSGQELQTAASIVKTHADELHDFALFTSPQFPQCNAAVTASELQLGINGTNGGSVPAGPATATVVHLTAPAGEQVFGVTTSFVATDGTTSIPVVVDQLVVGSDRAEGQLVAFGLGGTFPGDVLSSTIDAFEHRLATQGSGASA